MKNTTMNKLSSASLVLIMGYSTLSFGTSNDESFVDIYNSEFHACFSEGYNTSELSKDQLYTTAQCFTNLLQKEETQAVSLGASKLTIMQYSDSWYRAAADKGHKLAQKGLDKNLFALAKLEGQTHFGTAPQEEQMFASEKVFKILDTDKDGFISIAEASTTEYIKNDFSKTDFDNDGMLSQGEYTIQYGESTAAGQ